MIVRVQCPSLDFINDIKYCNNVILFSVSNIIPELYW